MPTPTTLIVKPDKGLQERKIQANICVNIDAKFPQIANQIQHCKVLYSRPSGIYFKYTKLVQHLKINTLCHQDEEKDSTIMSISLEQAFDKIQCQFIISKLGRVDSSLNLIKSIDKKLQVTSNLQMRDWMLSH